MKRMQLRKIIASVFMILGIVIIISGLGQLFFSWLLLPPYSPETEGKYIAFSLLLWSTLYMLPLGISLILIGYLISPLFLQRYRDLIWGISFLLMLGGFSATLLLIILVLARGLPVIFVILAFAASTPFWIMAILASIIFSRHHPTENDQATNDERTS
jgi:hypothetical protein